MYDLKNNPSHENSQNVKKDKPCNFSSRGAVSWTPAVGDVGGGGALRLVLFSEDSAEDPRLKPAIYGAYQHLIKLYKHRNHQKCSGLR